MSETEQIFNISLQIGEELITNSFDSESENNNKPFFSIRNPIFAFPYEGNFNYIIDENKSKESEGKNIESKENDNIVKNNNQIFIVLKEKIIEKKVLKRRGRQKSLEDCKKDRFHKFDSTDNILRKINTHFLSFIVNFLNDILNHLNYSQRFLGLNYNYKRNATKKEIEERKQKTIGDIICEEINGRYKKKNRLHNKEIYEQIKDNIILEKIFSENYLNIFKKIYHRGNKIINLKEYGLNEKIVLSDKTKMYNDLLLKDEIRYLSRFSRRKYNECVKFNFIQDSIFVQN